MKLTGNWIGGEASNRVLVIAYNTSPNSTYYFVVDPEQRSSLDREISLPGDEYNVSVFPFGENGRPFKRAATVPLPLTIANTGQSGQLSLRLYIVYSKIYYHYVFQFQVMSNNHSLYILSIVTRMEPKSPVLSRMIRILLLPVW